MVGKLSIVATPIGNLEDITLRALRVLKEADVVLCEDTRVTGKLLKHYDIRTKLVRCDAKKEQACATQAVSLLSEGKQIAYVSDAGTPGISDPGARLVFGVRERLPEAHIEVVPGPSALTSALSVAGIAHTDFLFLGFLPHKKGRETLFREIVGSDRTVVFYESPHRIIKSLTSLKKHLEELHMVDRTIVLARELTKLHEEVLVGTADELLAILLDDPQKVRGEFVVIVEHI